MEYTVFFDIETSVVAETAVVLEKPPVCQIAAVALDEYGTEVGWFEQKILFKQSDPVALDLIGYTEKRWQGAKYPAEVARMFAKWLEQFKCYEKISKRGNPYKVAILGGHNVNDFDLPVIHQWYRGLADHYNQKFYLPAGYRPSIDTLELVRVYQALSGEFGPAGLKHLCEQHGIELDHHEAVSDVRGCIGLYNVYRQLISDWTLPPEC